MGGDVGPLTLSGGGLGRDIDWHSYNEAVDIYDSHGLKVPTEATRTFSTRPKQQFSRLNAINGVGRDVQASGSLSARMPSMDHRKDALSQHGALTERTGLRTVEAEQKTRNMRDVLLPGAGSAAYASDVERHVTTCREQLSEMGAMHKAKERELNKILHDAAVDKSRQRANQLQDTQDAKQMRQDALDSARVRAREAYAKRTVDLQLIVESKHELEKGKLQIAIEPPSSPAWKKGAPPHLISHWDTITGHHQDPPQRQHVRLINSYRRAFPGADVRAETPPGAVWGGVNDGRNHGVWLAS